MSELVVDEELTLSYEVQGEGEPLLLVAGCGSPAVAWALGVAPDLVAAGYRVITYDNRGMPPSSAPPAPYTVDQMAADALALLDHLGERGPVRMAGHSLGGWIAETLALTRPERVRAAAFLGSANAPTEWEKAITTVERDLARLPVELPPLFEACEVLRYLPNAELQDDEVVAGWLTLLADAPAWPNPGRLGQYEACLAWSTDARRTTGWPAIRVPTLVLAFEHDIDSPPARAAAAAAAIPGARYVEIPGASHLAPMTHPHQVASALVEFFAGV